MAGPSLRPAGLGTGPAAGRGGSRAPGRAGRGRGRGRARPDTHRDDGGALAPFPPVSLCLGLSPLRSRRGLRSQRRPGLLSPPPALPAPRPSRSLLSLSPARGSSGARGRGGDSPLPGKYRSPRTPTPSGGAARPGPARRAAAAARPGAESRPLPVASSRGGFCKFHKMARAPNLRSEKRRGPSGGGGGSSARRARTARPRVPAQTDTHTHSHTHTHAHSSSHTLTHTHTLSHSHRSRPLAGGGSGTNSSSRNSSISRGGGGARTPRLGCPLPEPVPGRDQQQRRQQSPRIPPPLLPPPPPPHSNGAFYYYSGGKRKGLKKNQPTKWRRTDPVAIATVNQNAKPRLTC